MIGGMSSEHDHAMLPRPKGMPADVHGSSRVMSNALEEVYRVEKAEKRVWSMMRFQRASE